MENKINLRSKLPNTGISIFSIMTGMAHEYDAINLSQGYPDFEISSELKQLVNDAINNNHNQYAPMPGFGPLLEVIAKKAGKLNGIDINPQNEITITAGATEAIYSTIATLIQPGDEVIIFDPSYDLYVPSVLINGGIPVFYSMIPPDFAIDWDDVRKLITSKTKLIIINTPHNPTGKLLSNEDLMALSAIIEEAGLYILSDEVYEHIIFDERIHESILKYPVLRDHGIVASSFGKTFHATGWKVGYCIAPPALTAEIRKVHQFVTYCVNTPVQVAMATYLKSENNYLSIPLFFQKKRDLFLSLIASSIFKPITSEGTYFQVVSYGHYQNLPEFEMAKWLTQKIGVAAIPLSVFYHDKKENNLLRFCFAKEDHTLTLAAEKLCRI